MLPARAAPARKATNVMRLKTDRRGVAFPGSEEVFMLTPCRWRDDEQSARHLLAVFAAGVKICKASGKPGRARLRPGRLGGGEFPLSGGGYKHDPGQRTKAKSDPRG